MIIVNTIDELKTYLNKIEGIIGFVPTMGALHQGHLELVKQAKKNAHSVIVSIFVNPTQFNDLNDLTNYPKDIEQDCVVLNSIGCDIVFVPSIEDIYPPNMIHPQFDFKTMDKIMEGAARPGHFNGVAQVVNRLFDIVEPDIALFGEKDFQQLAIIKELVKQRNYDVQIISCPTVRDTDGLALSSRNVRLKQHAREVAPKIYQTIRFASQNIEQLNQTITKIELKDIDPREAEMWIKNEIEKHSDLLKVDYVSIVNRDTLERETTITNKSHICIAVYCDNVRLIDNIEISCS